MTSGVNLPFHQFSFRILYFKFDWVNIEKKFCGVLGEKLTRWAKIFC